MMHGRKDNDFDNADEDDDDDYSYEGNDNDDDEDDLDEDEEDGKDDVTLNHNLLYYYIKQQTGDFSR